MNQEILDKYGLKFVKEGRFYNIVSDTDNELVSFIVTTFLDEVDVYYFMLDVNLTLDNKFSQIEDEDWRLDISSGIIYMGTICKNKTFMISRDDNTKGIIIEVKEYPLYDIKIIVENWLTFIETYK